MKCKLCGYKSDYDGMLSHIKSRHIDRLIFTADGSLLAENGISILEMIEKEEE